jgi:hypothetical protein
MIETVAFMTVFIIIIGVGWLVLKQRRNTVWRQLASEIGAEYVESGLFGASQVKAHIKDWIITLDTHSVSSGDSGELYTRMSASFQNKSELQFTVFRAGIVSKLDKALGTKQINIGDPDFDRNLVVRGKNEAQVQAFFTNQKIRQMIQAQPSIRLNVTGNALLFETQGFIKDVERLKSLFELFKEVLNQLEK